MTNFRTIVIKKSTRLTLGCCEDILDYMRTTLTLDDDVAARLKNLQRGKDMSLKALVNQGLRLGLQQMESSRNLEQPYKTKPVDLGRCKFGNVDNIAEVIATAEGDFFK